MSQFHAIGKRVPKPDAWDKVTGRSVYLEDLELPRMLYGKVLRSPLAHARILHIDTSRAERVPGVKSVITATDTPMIPIGFGRDNWALKGGKVRCIGDEVAAVAAVDEDTAEEALELIRVEYEELPTIFDPEEALKPGVPLIHENRRDNLSMNFHFEHGEVEPALAESDYVFTDRYVLPFVNPCHLESHGCLASFDLKGNLTMWSSTQVPFLYQKDLADALGLPGSKVRVIKPVIGGGFGSKLEMYPFEVACAVMAQKTGRPVKMSLTREEEFTAARPRQPMIIDLTTGVKKDGRLWVRVAKCLLDNGAYNSWGCITPIVGMQTFTSFYKVQHCRYDAFIVYTNNPYSGAMRGYGNPQAIFAVESQMDTMAEKLGIDPTEFRLLNANQPNETTPQGMKITSNGYAECLKKAAGAVGWSEKRGRRDGRGVGLAGLLHVGGGARVYRSDGCGVTVKIDDMGKITVLSGASDMGQGSDTVQAQIVAEILGVLPEDITVIHSDTDIVPWDVGAHASRTTFVAGNAARLAALEAKKQLCEAASAQLKVAPEEIGLAHNRVFVMSDPTRSLPFDKLVRSMHFRPGGQMIAADAFYDPPNEMQDEKFIANSSAAYIFGVHAVEVEVDTETGKVEIKKAACAHDVGRAINPMAIEGQIHGGFAMGMGYALTEHLQVKDGRVLNPTLLDYRIATAKDMPPVESIIVETNDPEGPFGAKGIGEASLIPTAAAVANAVYDAIGVRIKELPITPEKILNALKEKKEGGEGLGLPSVGRTG